MDKQTEEIPCIKLIKDFEKCMRKFHSGEQDFLTTYNSCVDKYDKVFKHCGFKPHDIY